MKILKGIHSFLKGMTVKKKGKNTTNKKVKDLHAEREAQKYENPIASREYIMDYLRDHAEPVRRDELIDVLHLTNPDEIEGLRRRLRAMERDGQIVYTGKKGFSLAETMDIVRGRVIGHRDGFGFVVAEDGGGDLFLNARQMQKVFHNDIVSARVIGIDRRGRREGTVIEVLERSLTSVVGRFYSERGVNFVIPDDRRIQHNISIAPEDCGVAKQGQIVVAEIISPLVFRAQPLGKVIEILGEHMAPGMEVEIAVRTYNIPHEWPQEVLNEVAQLSPEVKEEDKQNRADLRHLPLVTIDGEDAKDFDDAVYCEKQNDGWVLYVAIADVSHYVAPKTALDIEAVERGNSVYFPGSVVPMLPEILSNGLCSLKPETDRLCLVAEITLDNSGKVTSYKFYPAVMHSQARLTYTYVAAVLENPALAVDKKAKHLLPHLQNLFKLYEILRANRDIRGAIDFETTETKIIFGENRKIEKIIPAERNVAHKIIEECMLLANVCTAEFLLKHEIPALYRIHDGPNTDKLQDLRRFLAEVGLRLPGKSKLPEPADYAALLQSIRGRPDAHLIQTVLLRSLSQAVYSPDNSGHFGLAYDAYAHFTSPIRRYPDLLVHRAIRQVLTKGKKNTFPYQHIDMEKFGLHCSMTERRADEATRDATDWLKCEYVKDRIGEEFEGIVTNVTAFGLFIELKDIYIEGLLHISALKNDYFQFDPLHHRLRGERSGVTYHLGDKVSVRVARVDLDDRKIDFELIDGVKKAVKKSKNKKASKPGHVKKKRTR